MRQHWGHLVAKKLKLRSNLLSYRPLTQGAFLKLPCLSQWERVAEGRVRGLWPIEPHSSAVWGCSLPIGQGGGVDIPAHRARRRPQTRPRNQGQRDDEDENDDDSSNENKILVSIEIAD